jgi:cell division protein FtsX
MTTIIVNIDSENDAKDLANVLKNLNYVKSVKYFKSQANKEDFLTDEEWVKPGKPATEEEFNALLKRSVESANISYEVSKKHNLKRFTEWVDQNAK